MEIEKSYFTLPEILARWAMPEADFAYLAENDLLRLSVRVFSVPVEFGDYEETGGGQLASLPWERGHYSGLLDLHARDVFHVFRDGAVNVRHFRTPRAHYAQLCNDTEHLLVRIIDLLLRREERDRFEAESGVFLAHDAAHAGAFQASDDYHDVICSGHRFRMGAIQAQVVRALHEAAKAGEPWQSGKEILAVAGSRSLKMADVFKSQTHWRALIESNGRGAYRLAGLSTNRQRLPLDGGMSRGMAGGS
jgi:hypothetical protein